MPPKAATHVRLNSDESMDDLPVIPHTAIVDGIRQGVRGGEFVTVIWRYKTEDDQLQDFPWYTWTGLVKEPARDEAGTCVGAWVVFTRPQVHWPDDWERTREIQIPDIACQYAQFKIEVTAYQTASSARPDILAQARRDNQMHGVRTLGRSVQAMAAGGPDGSPDARSRDGPIPNKRFIPTDVATWARLLASDEQELLITKLELYFGVCARSTARTKATFELLRTWIAAATEYDFDIADVDEPLTSLGQQLVDVMRDLHISERSADGGKVVESIRRELEPAETDKYAILAMKHMKLARDEKESGKKKKKKHYYCEYCATIPDKNPHGHSIDYCKDAPAALKAAKNASGGAQRKRGGAPAA